MATVWFLKSDVNPVDAYKEGSDATTCGDCKFKWSDGGSCYVLLHQAPLNIYKAYKRGRYPTIDSFERLRGLSIRIGGYGDPNTVPTYIIDKIVEVSRNHTSYTHAWRTSPELISSSMASVDSLDEYVEAKKQGFRTFRVTENPEFLFKNEIICPNTTNGTLCYSCNLCSGAKEGDKRKDIVIEVHGSKKKRFKETPIHSPLIQTKSKFMELKELKVIEKPKTTKTSLDEY